MGQRMRNSNNESEDKKAHERDKVMFMFVGENCPECDDNNDISELKEKYDAYRDSLNEINAMIQHFQDLGNADEVASWRRMLMREKMTMREIKSKINFIMDANNMAKEIAYS